jgi:hypothetical protein
MVDDSGFPGTFHRAPDYPLTEIRIKVDELANIIRDVFFREVGVVLTVDMIQRGVAEIVRRAAR